jgi:MFS family permease
MSSFSWLNRTIVALGLVSFFSDLGSEMATAVLPAFMVSLGYSAAFLGIIEGIANASNSFTSILAGWGSDYTSRRKPFATIGYFLAALGIGFLSLAQNRYQIAFGRVLTRIGKGVREPARDALLVHATRPVVYGRMFGFHRMMDNLGAIFGPLLALILIKILPLRTIFIIAFIPVLFSCVIIVFAIKEVYAKGSSKINILGKHIAHLSPKFKAYLCAVGIFGLGNCATSLLVLRVIELLQPAIGITHANWYSILFYALFNGLYAFFSYPVGYLADFVGKKLIIVIGYLLMAIGLFGFAFAKASYGYLFLLFIIAGCAYAIIDGVQRAIAADLLPHEIQGTGYGILAAIAGLGSLFSSIMVGFLWSTISPLIGFGYAAVLCLLGAVFMLRVKS